jgi:EAL domain-containing protein (putative c-di-GMP-specific phosphodiesterase class I)
MSRAKLFRFYIDQLRDKDVGWISYNIRGSDLIGRNFSELIDFCSPKNCGLQICLELSEEEISERIDLPGLRQKLEILKTYGFKIYLDDFGKERSNFHRLVELPFDVIKIDRVLVKNLGFSERSDKLIAFLSALTKEFDMRLIAEGVETDLQAKILLNNNLNLHQGYLYGRPQQIP